MLVFGSQKIEIHTRQPVHLLRFFVSPFAILSAVRDPAYSLAWNSIFFCLWRITYTYEIAYSYLFVSNVAQCKKLHIRISPFREKAMKRPKRATRILSAMIRGIFETSLMCKDTYKGKPVNIKMQWYLFAPS